MSRVRTFGLAVYGVMTVHLILSATDAQDIGPRLFTLAFAVYTAYMAICALVSGDR